MNTKLQELTDKIYTEGEEKGKEDASEIVSKAQSEAAQIVADAQRKAEEIVKAAEQKSEELDKNTRSELNFFAGQAVNSQKSDITNLVCGDIVSSSVKAATADKSFMQSMILKFVEQWSSTGSVEISANDAEGLKSYFESQAKDLLDKGVTIVSSKGKSDFVIQPSEGGYKVSFGDEEFIAYFKEFMRPQLIEMLF